MNLKGKITICLLLLAAVLSGSCNKEPVLTPGDVPVPTVRMDGYYAAFDEQASTFLATLPAVTDFSAIPLQVSSGADRILMDGEELPREGMTLDFRQPRSIRVIFGNTYHDFTLSARNTGLPVVRLNTPRPITSKEDWVAGASLRIENADGSLDYEGPTSVRGRGNSTWNYPKKPYAIKLDEKAEILGMPSHKRWVLLANWKDRTILRNDAAFWLSKQSGLEYTVRGQFVELVLNGKHAGNYYLCEQIKINKKRVNVEDGGYLIEMDTYFDEVNRFLSEEFQLPWMVKEPDEDELSPEAFAALKEWVRKLEALLKDEDRVLAHEYESWIDVDSAIDYLLVEELTANHDFYNTWPTNMPPGPHSTYLYLQPDGKLFTGPVWDFDYHSFVPDRTHFWAGADKTMYYPALLKDPKFRERLVERWEMQKDRFRQLPAYIDGMAEYLSLSQAVNQVMWPIDNKENGDETMSYNAAVERMKKAFTDKWEWMDANIRNLK